jgi:membrane dipeptidase
MPAGRTPSLTPEEARQLHNEALVIDTQQPPITSGIVFTPGMRETVQHMAERGRTRSEAGPAIEAALVRDIQTSDDAKRMYLDMWRESGVTVACGTYSGSHKPSQAYDSAVRKIANAHAIAAECEDEMMLIRSSVDIHRAHFEGRYGVLIDFQNTLPIGDDLDRIQTFHGLGLRMVQLTYNLDNLVGDGCTDANKAGLSLYGREMVRRLNEMNIIVDVSHCSEQVGWDAMDVSSAPVIVSHSAAKGVAYHDRGKSDELAKAVAEQGGYFGVVTLPGFIRDTPGGSLDDVVKQVEHLVNVCGIDHVGLGTDKAGPGPGTSSLVEYPDSMPQSNPDEFDWVGFRMEEHRLTSDYDMDGFRKFSDWPNITVALAEAGFNEDELRKLLGQNYLRAFEDIVG